MRGVVKALESLAVELVIVESTGRYERSVIEARREVDSRVALVRPARTKNVAIAEGTPASSHLGTDQVFTILNAMLTTGTKEGGRRHRKPA